MHAPVKGMLIIEPRGRRYRIRHHAVWRKVIDAVVWCAAAAVAVALIAAPIAAMLGYR